MHKHTTLVLGFLAIIFTATVLFMSGDRIKASLGMGMSSSVVSTTSSSSVTYNSSDSSMTGHKGDICTKNIQCKPLACINGTCQ